MALECDLGLVQSYMAGQYVVEPLDAVEDYDQASCCHLDSADESNIVLGDPVGLMRLSFVSSAIAIAPNVSSSQSWFWQSLLQCHGKWLTFIISKLGSTFYLRYKLTMDNSERFSSPKNIHAHSDLSNDLCPSFLDFSTLMN